MRLIGAAAVALTLALFLPLGLGSAQAAKAPTGQEIFRYDTFGDEQLWTDALGLHEAFSLFLPGLPSRLV